MLGTRGVLVLSLVVGAQGVKGKLGRDTRASATSVQEELISLRFAVAKVGSHGRILSKGFAFLNYYADIGNGLLLIDYYPMGN